MATLSAIQQWTATVGVIGTLQLASSGTTRTAVSMYTLDNAPLEAILQLKFNGDASATTGVVAVYYSWFQETGTASAAVAPIKANNWVLGIVGEADSLNTQIMTTRIPVDGPILGVRVDNSTSGSVTVAVNIVKSLIRDNQA